MQAITKNDPGIQPDASLTHGIRHLRPCGQQGDTAGFDRCLRTALPLPVGHGILIDEGKAAVSCQQFLDKIISRCKKKEKRKTILLPVPEKSVRIVLTQREHALDLINIQHGVRKQMGEARRQWHRA